MKISSAGEYAVRIMVQIAKSEGFISLKDVASKEDISLKYAEKIVSKLVKAKLLESQRGQDGGYKLASPANKSTIAEILLVTGDASPVSACLSSNCPHKETCKSISVWERLNSLINNYLSTVTIQSLLDNE